MIVIALHLDMAARGLDPNDATAVRKFAEATILKLNQRVVRSENIVRDETLRLSRIAERATARAAAAEARAEGLADQVRKLMMKGRVAA